MSSLKKINESTVISDDGFKVKFDRYDLTYIEGLRYVKFPTEHLANPYKMQVDMSFVDLWEKKGRPDGKINAIEKNIIRSRLYDCLSILDLEFEIIH